MVLVSKLLAFRVGSKFSLYVPCTKYYYIQEKYFHSSHCNHYWDVILWFNTTLRNRKRDYFHLLQILVFICVLVKPVEAKIIPFNTQDTKIKSSLLIFTIFLYCTREGCRCYSGHFIVVISLSRFFAWLFFCVFRGH